MRIEWTYPDPPTGDLTGFIIRIASTSESPNKMTSITVDSPTNRSRLVVGVQPYRYNSPEGVMFIADVAAYNSVGQSNPVRYELPILLPRKSDMTLLSFFPWILSSLT